MEPPQAPLRASTRSPPRVALQQPSHKSKGSSKSNKFFRRFRAIVRSFPIITPSSCRMPVELHGVRTHDGHIHGATRMTGTLFGHRKDRVNLAVQENPRSLPTLLLELAIPTGKLLQEMGSGLVRIALEAEKKPAKQKVKIMDEPIWTLYCNGRKCGYGVKREPTTEDLAVMQVLHAVSMGAGVLPEGGGGEHPDGELTYMRAPFERVVGSRDSETYYMMNPDGNSGGPELIIFFVRI